MANLPLAFIEIVLGGVILDAGIKGASIADVVKGEAKQNPISGLTGSSTGSGGGSGSNTGAGGAKQGFANPFASGWTPGRLDKGYDGTFVKQISSPVTGTVTYATTSFSNWGAWVEVKADQAIPGLPSDTFYFAEGLTPTVKTGQHVTAGQQIATPNISGPDPQHVPPGTIEWGIAEPGTVGSPTNPWSAGVADPSVVLAFVKWAETMLGVKGTTDTGSAGSF